MSSLEPTLSSHRSTLGRYVAATRPGFLSVTAVAVLLGLATAAGDGIALDSLTALVTALFALVAQAGVNVVNDYYDALNGTDAINDERRFPFTGGSRFIQNGLIGPRATAVFGFALLASVVPAGLWLMQSAGPNLLWIGVAGLVIGWAYSAPPLALMSRGLGELAVACGWLLIVVGTDLVQRHQLAALPFLAGISYALQVANVLIVNQFPDYRADAATGKRNLVVRLGPARARWLPPLVAAFAALWLCACITIGSLPVVAAIALLSLIPSGIAAGDLIAGADRPSTLDRAIRATIAAAHLHGMLLVLALAFMS
jgi:1,4-dihydroxy-2-naphthoate octaprenyltransferase